MQSSFSEDPVAGSLQVSQTFLGFRCQLVSFHYLGGLQNALDVPMVR